MRLAGGAFATRGRSFFDSRAGGLADVEAEGAEHFAAVVGDLVGAPRRHPDPFDPEVVDEAVEGGTRLVLDDVGQRACRRRQRHREHRVAVLVDVDTVDEAQVHDVDAELGVDDVLHRLEHVALGGGSVGSHVDVGQGAVIGGHRFSPVVDEVVTSACATASFQAIHDSSAHLMRPGNFATPAKAMPSSRISSSGSTWPLPCIIVLNSSSTVMPSETLLPRIRSLSTDADAWLIEQPSAA